MPNAAEVSQLLEAMLPAAQTPPCRIHEAMRYSVLAGGKRIRPRLYYAAAQAVNPTMDVPDEPALAIEILHTYTLIHDDLPAMDDDDLRRGKPAVHVAFSEAEAILAGDALLTMAFEWMAEVTAPPPHHPTTHISELARAAGSTGVIGGQAADLAAEGQTISPEELEYIHAHKTARLLQAALKIGGIMAGGRDEQIVGLDTCGLHLGMAFQIIDDILDETATTEALGKPHGSDREEEKSTFVQLYGLAASRQAAAEHTEKALAQLTGLPGNTTPLNELTKKLLQREY